MKDTIYRQQALEGLYDVFFDDELSAAYPEEADKVLDVIRKLPSAQSEQKKGKWERVYLDHVAFGERPSIFYCSSCNQCVPFPTNFCPACGSDNRQS